jgi:hypothetical protein
MMDEEIDEDALAAMLADDEEEEQRVATLSFAEQAETMSGQELVALACTLVDTPTSKPKKEPAVKFSDRDLGELFAGKSLT